MLSPESLPRVQQALTEAGLDGWLLYDFRGTNPIAANLIGLRGMVTRRVFAWIPRSGAPVAVTHAIEQKQWSEWPGEWVRRRYSAWPMLEEILGQLVKGQRVAMEYSPGDAVPYVDRVPAGVLEMVRTAGAEVVSSGDLVTRFYALWNAKHLAAHQRTAETISRIAHDALSLAGRRARGEDGNGPIMEHELQRFILDAFLRAKLETDHGPIVAIGSNASNPHYEPSPDHPQAIEQGHVLLIDLWAREPEAPYADQTWMASIGAPDDRAVQVWEAVRDARDSAIAALHTGVAEGGPLRGATLDDAARRVIAERGFGEYFTHRTGHSIDPIDLHGSGPHLDNFETREERLLIPGVGFSIEPGVYIDGQIGVRSEVNAYVGDGEAIITPASYQRELIVP